MLLMTRLLPPEQGPQLALVVQEWRGIATRLQGLTPCNSEVHSRLASCQRRCGEIQDWLNNLNPAIECYECRDLANELQGITVHSLPIPNGHQGPYICIESLTTHPANILPLGDRPITRGVGKELVKASLEKAISIAAEGVIVDPAPSSTTFYKHMKFVLDDSKKYYTIRTDQIRARFLPSTQNRYTVNK